LNVFLIRKVFLTTFFAIEVLFFVVLIFLAFGGTDGAKAGQVVWNDPF
jgi:hypothetical protein